MRRIVVEAEMSLDGYIGGEDAAFWQHVFPFHSEDVQAYLDGILFEPDALLMGSKTFQFFAEVWPEREGKQAVRINNMPKYVASRSLKEPLAWNGTLLKGEAVEEIRRLKQQSGGSLLQYGVGELTHAMLKAGLIDEFRIMVFPFTVGEGLRIFDHMGTNTLQLVDSRQFSSGAIALRYTMGPH